MRTDRLLVFSFRRRQLLKQHVCLQVDLKLDNDSGVDAAVH